METNAETKYMVGHRVKYTGIIDVCNLHSTRKINNCTIMDDTQETLEPMSCLTEEAISQYDSEIQPIMQIEKKILKMHNEITNNIKQNKNVEHLITQVTMTEKSQEVQSSDFEVSCDSDSDDSSIVLASIKDIIKPLKKAETPDNTCRQLSSSSTQTHKQEKPLVKPITTRILPRSACMRTLSCGSMYIKEDFPVERLPIKIRSFKLYGVYERGYTSCPNLFENTYVVKRLVDNVLGINVKTIDNYFRKNPPPSFIGYVIHSKYFPEEGQKELSPCHKYLVISLHYLKIWWETSSIMQRKMRESISYVWPHNREDYSLC